MTSHVRGYKLRKVVAIFVKVVMMTEQIVFMNIRRVYEPT